MPATAGAHLAENPSRPVGAMHRLTLRFPGDLEARFLAEYARDSVRQVRVALVVAAVLFAVFGVVDLWLIPDAARLALSLRYGVVFFLLVALGFSFSRHFERVIQPVTAASAVIAGLGLAGIVIVAPPVGRDLHHRGLLLLIVAAYTFIRLRFVYAAGASLLITANYNVTELLFGDVPWWPC